MSCECSTSSTNTNSNTKYANCVADTVRFINRLQQAVVPTEIGCNRCNSPVLGETSRANTRPFILYLPNGEAFKPAFLTDSPQEPLPVFRVEDVCGNCATLRALTRKHHGCMNGGFEFDDGYDQHHGELVPTRTCLIVNLNDFVAIQCLEDVFLNLEVCDCARQ